jgi:hypothetical protein
MAREREFKFAILALQQENQRQRSLPDCPMEHWGWIPHEFDRHSILKQISVFAEEIRRPSYLDIWKYLTIGLR